MGALRDRGEFDYVMRNAREMIEDLYRNKGEISRRECEEALRDAYRRITEYYRGLGPTDPFNMGMLDIRAGNKMMRIAMPHSYDRVRGVEYFSAPISGGFADDFTGKKQVPQPTTPQKVQPKKQVKLLLLTKEA